MIPLNSHCWVIRKGDLETTIPVVGYTLNKQGFAVPVLLVNSRPLAAGDGLVEQKTGKVYDLSTGVTHPDVGSFDTADVPYSIGDDLDGKPQGPGRPAAPKKGLTKGPFDVTFDPKKVYAKNSTWQFVDDDYAFIFQIEGDEHPAPKDPRVTKITRDDFMAHKKAGTDVKSLAEVIGDVAPEPETEEEDFGGLV